MISFERSYDRETRIRQMLLLYDWGLMIASYLHLSFSFFLYVYVYVGVGGICSTTYDYFPLPNFIFPMASSIKIPLNFTMQALWTRNDPMGINFLAFCVVRLTKILRVLH